MQKKKTNRLGLVLGIIAVVLVMAALIGVYIHFTAPPAPEPTPGGTTQNDGENETPETGTPFTVIVVHADGSEKTFEYRSEETYVGDVLVAEGLVKGEMGDYGLYIKEVDGEKAVWEENQAYWSFYIGEEYALTGVDMTPIEEGKVYKLVYTKG